MMRPYRCPDPAKAGAFLMLVALAAVAGCKRDDGRQPIRQVVDTPEPAATGCVPDVGIDSALALARSTIFATGAAAVDTATLLPRGPRTVIAASSGYDPDSDYPDGAVVFRLQALDSIAYPRFHLAAGGTTYVWAQRCGGTLRLVFLSDAGTMGPRAPAWPRHEHTAADSGLVRFRDTTITGDPDSLLAAGMIDSTMLDYVVTDTAPKEEPTAMFKVTAICGSCKLGWCTGV